MNTMVIPPSECARLGALHRLNILDSEYEQPFNRIVRMVAEFFNIPNVGIHLLDDERQWVKAFEGQRFACPREDSVCQFTLSHDDLLVIPDLRDDLRTCDLGIVTGSPYLRFYAGTPLRTRDGYVVGTLCLIACEPRPPLDANQERWLLEFAGLVIETMELRADYHRSQLDLLTAVEFDPITGLRNLASLIREGQRLLDDSAATSACAMKISLDRMDVVIGAAGQNGNNEVLREAAKRLRAALGPDELLGRGDGDNFVIVRVCHLQGDDRAFAAISHQVLCCLAEPMAIEGQQFNITASVGYATFADALLVYEVVDSASAASLASQNNGGNQAQRFDPTAFARLRERVSMESALRDAVAGCKFTVHYQPIVDITTGTRVVGAEALARWPRSDGQWIGPDLFIAMAEELGLIHELGLWVFDTACRDLATWSYQGHDLWISVNLSPLQLNDPYLADKLAERAHVAGVDCSRIKLEITESAVSAHIDDFAELMDRLRSAGFLLALDDFGTGYSSLARLIRMPFDTLKVDRGFVSDCPAGPGAAVLTSVSALAHHLGMKLVAEGVEVETQDRFLRSQRYTFAQGYYYARPMPAASLAEFLQAPRS